MNNPSSKIVAQRLQQFDDLRSLFPKRPPLPPHHVLIEELHDAMACCSPALKGKVSLSTLIEILQSINAKLDTRSATPPHSAGVVVTDAITERVAHDFCQTCLHIPSWSKLKENDRKHVIDAMRAALVAALGGEGECGKP